MFFLNLFPVFWKGETVTDSRYSRRSSFGNASENFHTVMPHYCSSWCGVSLLWRLWVNLTPDWLKTQSVIKYIVKVLPSVLFLQGNDPTALSVLTQAITGQVGFMDADFCIACGEKGAEKRCSICKMVNTL